jgi:hypothetical protein
MPRRRDLTFFDFPLPPGGLSDADGQAWLDGYARYDALMSMAEAIDPTTMTHVPAHPPMVFARNHTEHAATTVDVDRWAAECGYEVVGVSSALDQSSFKRHMDELRDLGYQVRSARAPKVLGQFNHRRAAADYLAATVPVQPQFPLDFLAVCNHGRMPRRPIETHEMNTLAVTPNTGEWLGKRLLAALHTDN